MSIQYTFKHMESSSALRDYADAKISEQLEKFVSKPTGVHVTFVVEKHEHTSQCHINGGDGLHIQVEHTSEDMYASVDRMIDKLNIQLKKQKEKLKDHKGHASISDIAPDALSVEDRNFEDASINAEDIVKLKNR